MNSKSRVRRATKASGSQRGTALVETGILTILVLLMMFLVIDFGRAAYAYHFVSDVARDATRYAAVRGNTYYSNACTTTTMFACDAGPDAVVAYVKSIVPSGIYINSSATGSSQAGYLYVNPTWPGTAGNGGTCAEIGSDPTKTPGCVVSVTINYTYGFDLPLLHFSAIQISSTSQMVISQ